MFVLAHLSDPHLAPLPAPRLSELLNKRALGYFNWRRKRSAVHRAEVLAAVVSDLQTRAFDHLAVTGDLINIALEAEFAPARKWLQSLGSPERVTLVPGNHDAYVSGAAARLLDAWDGYMRGDLGESFPFVRRRGPVALIGLSSAVATPPFMATGQLGAEQLARLDGILAELAREGLFRIVLIHHPPVSDAAHYIKRLTDGAALRAVLQRRGAELLVHGHDHVRNLIWLDGPNGPIPAVGVPSASAASNDPKESGGYHKFEIERASNAWRCTLIARGRVRNGQIAELERKPLLN